MSKLQKLGFVTQMAVVKLPELMKPVTTLNEVGKRNCILPTAKSVGLPGVVFCCVHIKGST
jgi:hypothetical protein